ncbi:MAG: ABC transporter ATP-binding protein/permease [Campylobacter gracilis]|uniref:ABC transporter ATP-binding protein/permease n=1 Tax=Campylobacter gracilis TaxID=824 RepID=UPI0026EA2FC1|nr:SbmA/BacA-like family transporter [Campylobacter gracilis]MBS6153147.1 ABC transporter ATP-binding protein/permease [Campylobacter gracilis]
MKTLKQFFEILRPHWFGKGAAKLWALLLLALGFSLAIIKISVLMNAWDKRFYDALSELKGELIPALVGEFLLYTALIVLFIVCGSWLRKLLVIVWRERLSAMMERKWLHNANFYRTSLDGNFSARGGSNLEKPGDANLDENLNERAEYSAVEADSTALHRDAKGFEILPSTAEQNAAEQSGAGENKISSKTCADREISKTIAKLDNPDQRIAEDSLLLVQKSVDLVKSLVYNLAKLIAFVTILWQVSKVLKFEIFGMRFEIEGFLLYVALLYTLLCSLITHLIGRRLRRLNFAKQRAEADYRSDLLLVRENAEAVAFMRGEGAERGRFRASFGEIMRNWRSIMNTEFRLECFSASYLKITNLIPIFACLPLYLSRAMSFGDMMQARSAFYSVQDGFAWFMDYYKQIMEWAASVQRIYEFISRMDGESANLRACVKQSDENSARCEGLSVFTPAGEPLIEDLRFELAPAQFIMLRGKSGAGKSTALRYVAGLWRYGRGEISLPRTGVMFIPQKPYLAPLSLKELIAYPQPPRKDDAEFLEILRSVGLKKFARMLNSRADYVKILSGGEAQRLSFARIHYHKPSFVFADEITSALDPASARELLLGLRADLSSLGMLAIVHQTGLEDIFERTIEL